MSMIHGHKPNPNDPLDKMYLFPNGYDWYGRTLLTTKTAWILMSGCCQQHGHLDLYRQWVERKYPGQHMVFNNWYGRARRTGEIFSGA